jgi:hypothetical protein
VGARPRYSARVEEGRLKVIRWWPGRLYQFWDVDTGKPLRVRDRIVNNAHDRPLEEGGSSLGDDAVRMALAGPGEVTVEAVSRGVWGEDRCAAAIRPSAIPTPGRASSARGLSPSPS